MCLLTEEHTPIMVKNMLPTITRALLVLAPLGLMVFLSSCAGDSGGTQTQYTNPGKPEVYSADERGYEKPWPFGDLGTNPQQ
jgi:hypothetical protein